MNKTGNKQDPKQAYNVGSDPFSFLGKISPDINRWISAIIDCTVAFFIFGILVDHLKLPFDEAPKDFVTFLGRIEYNPMNNFFKYLLLLFGTASVFLVTFLRGKSIAAPLYNALTSTSLFRRITFWCILICCVTAVFINLTAILPREKLEDTFHEGEYLGNLPAALQAENPFEIVTIHGFGKDIAASLIGHYFARHDNTIILTRLINVITQLLAYIAYLLIIIMAVRLQNIRLSTFYLSALALIGIVILGLFGIHIDNTPDHPRNFVYFWQMVLILWFFTNVQNRRHWLYITTVAFILGASMPLAFLYVYNRAILLIMTAVFITIPVFMAYERKTWLSWVFGIISGVIAGVAILTILIGFEAVAQIFQQVAYWSKYGSIYVKRFIAGVSGMHRLYHFHFGIIIQCIAGIYIYTEYRRIGNLRKTIADNSGIIILFLAAVLFMQSGIPKNPAYRYWGAVMAGSLAITMSIIVLLRNVKLHAPERIPGIIVAGYILLLISIGQSPIETARTVRRYVTYAATPDTKLLLKDYKDAVDELKEEVKESGYFFAATSEGVWYHLFNTPSPSRFQLPHYARPFSAQREIVSSLEEKKPEIILFSNDYWRPGARAFTDQNIFNNHYIIAQYLMISYWPYKVIGEHWFWRRSEKPVQFSDEKVGNADSVPAYAKTKRDVIVSGKLSIDIEHPDNIGVFITMGEDNLLIWAERGFKDNLKHLAVLKKVKEHWRWFAQIPTAPLPKGKTTFRFWLMPDPTLKVLYPLGNACEIDIR